MLSAGANDLGGALINESITRAAGATHGQIWSDAAMRAAIQGLARPAQQRTTRYQPVRLSTAGLVRDAELIPVVQTAAGRKANSKRVFTG